MKLKDTGYTEEEIKDLVKTYMIDTYERFDFIAEKGEGMYLYDPEGRKYLDFYGGIAVNNAGFILGIAILKSVSNLFFPLI